MTEQLFLYYRLSYALQLFCAEFLFLGKSRRRPGFVPKALAGIPLLLLLSLPLHFPVLGAVVGSSLIFGMSFLLVLLLYDEPWQHLLYLCVSADILQNAAMNLGKILQGAKHPLTPSMFYFNIVTTLAATAAACGLCCVLLISRIDLRGHEDRLIPLLPLSAAGACMIITMNTILGSHNLDENLYARLILFFADCMILFIQYLLLINDRLRYERSVIEKVLAAEREHYRLSQAMTDLINMKYHDIRHQVLALRNAFPGEQEKALQEIEDAANIYNAITKTGNDALDSILTEKLLLCRSRQIAFTYMVDGKSLSFLEPLDLYSLFGNALENAIESVSGAPRDLRMISLCVTSRGNMTSIHLENYCPDPPVFENGDPVTSKKDRENHGYGVKSIRYLARKYGGNVTFHAEHDLFMLDILLPGAFSPSGKE